MSTEPLPPVEPPAGPPPAIPPTAAAAPAAPAVPPPGVPPQRRVPSRGVLVAALVVAVVLLVGSVGATAAFVSAHATAEMTRVVGPNGRMFVFPGPGRDGQRYQLPQDRQRQGMPMGPGHRYLPGPEQTSPTPSPTSAAG